MRTTLLNDRPRTGKWRAIIQRAWNFMPISMLLLGLMQSYGHPEHALPLAVYGITLVVVMATSCCLNWLQETFEIRRKR